MKVCHSGLEFTAGIATAVSTELYIASLGSINTDNMDYSTDTYLRQNWRDPRLASEEWQVDIVHNQTSHQNSSLVEHQCWGAVTISICSFIW